MRGVYATRTDSGRGGRGSSPHARGLRRQGVHGLLERRIIPACAGFTPPGPTQAGAAGDHPRMRGVYDSPRQGGRDMAGSSPHARGLPGRHARRHRGGPDHPRTRGVYGQEVHERTSVRGSSPHTRGLRGPAPSGLATYRIIPAHAGFTSVSSVIVISSPDHPRTRGVYHGSLLSVGWLLGSSPHTRGLRPRTAALGEPGRIIPAHAGFTRPGTWPYSPQKDHPRTRGVYEATSATGTVAVGSSPHTRGLRG